MKRKEEFQIKKVRRNVPKWFHLKPTQINSQILLNFLEIYSDNNIVKIETLKQKCSHLKTFQTNFSKMIDFTEKNNGKVFNVEGNKIYLWSPVKDFILSEYEKYNKTVCSIIYPDDIEDTKIIEGKRQTIIVNAYERNPKARTKCIEHYGYDCTICGFNFEKVYGEIGKDFIHVHHIIPISKIKDTYEVDPIHDMRPVCPNCHAMLHREKEVKSIDKIREIIR